MTISASLGYNSTQLVGGFSELSFQLPTYYPYDTIHWSVDWGDGSSLDLMSYYYLYTGHTYSEPGTYHITVTATETGSGTTDTGDMYLVIRSSSPQMFPGGAVELGPEGSFRVLIDDVPSARDLDLKSIFTGPTVTDHNGEQFNFNNLVDMNYRAYLKWFSYTAPRDGTLVFDATVPYEDGWEPIAIFCTENLSVINQMFTVEYYPMTHAHAGVRVQQGKRYLFAIGLDSTEPGAYLDLTWQYQERTISGPCMYVLSGDSYGVLAYAVQLGDSPRAEPAMWMTDTYAYWGRPAGTAYGDLYVPRGGSWDLNAQETGLMKAKNELLNVPPTSVFEGSYTSAQDATLEWSSERQQLFIYDDYNATNLKMSGQKFIEAGLQGWVFEDALNELRQGDSFDIVAPAGMAPTTVRVVAMTRYAIYNVGDTITVPVPTFSGQQTTAAYSTFVDISGGEKVTVTFPSVTYPTYSADWDYNPIFHYMVVDDTNIVLDLVNSVDPEIGPGIGIIYALNESGTQDWWLPEVRKYDPAILHEGSYVLKQHWPDDWSGRHIRGNNFYVAELYDEENVTLSAGSYSSYSGLRQSEIVCYRLDENHVATETMRFLPNLMDLAYNSYSGYRYFTVNSDETRLLVTYDKRNPVAEPSNPYHFNEWYTGGMWIQIYDLTTPVPTFMHEFRFVPWPSLPGTYTSEPGFNTYEFYAYGTVEFDPTDENYCYMINNSDVFPGNDWRYRHQTYVFRIPLYADYATQYAAMRKPYLTFNNPDAEENFWFSFGLMGPMPMRAEELSTTSQYMPVT